MRLLRHLICFVPLITLAALGCSSETEGQKTDPPLDIPEGCNPIAYEHDCLLPYPSDFFLEDDVSLPGGKRVALTEAARPKDKNDRPIDFTLTHPVDGFSTHMPILAYFPRGVHTEGVVFHTDDPTKSLSPESKVMLVDAQSGAFVPVWAEVDKSTEGPSEQAFIVRPFVRLQNGHRYIVAIQGLLEPTAEGGAGAMIEAPQGFARIRDGRAASDPKLGPLAARYDKEIFPVLKSLGVAREKLQLAWDFTTSSEEVNTRDMLDLRADLIPKLEAKPPVVTVAKVTENQLDMNGMAPKIWLRVEGTIRVPLYLESDAPGAKLFRDASGKVTQNGEAEVPFTLQVPWSLKPQDASFVPARIFEYGHGFFGSREEIDYGSFMRGYSDEAKTVTVAVDWWGMSDADLNVVIETIFGGDAGTVFDFVDRLHQSMANMLALAYAVKGPLTQVPELRPFDKSIFDPDKLYYYGISQGAIFGVTLMSLAPPVLDRAALGVGGGPYSLMMSRSASYQELYGLLMNQIQSPLTMTKFMALSQSTWDRVDPMTYAPHLLKDTFPGSPANRHVLMQIGIGDHSVNNLSSHLMARAAGIPLLDPSPRSIWGLDTVTGPVDDALTVVDFQLATEPGIECRIPTADEKNGVHEGVRHNPKIKLQLDAFFQPNGQIENFCDGPCNPE